MDALAASIELYTVLTRERAYPGVNLERYEVTRRGPKGAYWLSEVDAYFIQIIEVQPQYSTTNVETNSPYVLRNYAQSPAAEPTSNVGNVQPQTPTSQQQQMGQAALATQIPQWYSSG